MLLQQRSAFDDDQGGSNATVGIFPGLHLMQSIAGYKKYRKISFLDFLESSKSNNQAIWCLKTVTFVVSDLL